jgi:hypothetical protein
LISVRSEVQILPGPPLTQRCAASFPCRAAHAGGASAVAAARRNQGCAGGVAQLGERLLCKQEVIGSIPFTSTTDRTMPSNVRSKRDGGALGARESAGGEARRRARALLCADRGEADLAIGHDAHWRLIFDRVNREYLSSMIGCGGGRDVSSSVGSGRSSVQEKSVFMRRRVARG